MAGEELALFLRAGLTGEAAVSDGLSDGFGFTFDQITLLLGARLARETAVCDGLGDGLSLALLDVVVSGSIALLSTRLAWEAAVRAGLCNSPESVTSLGVGNWLRIGESSTVGSGGHDGGGDECGELHVDVWKSLFE